MPNPIQSLQRAIRILYTVAGQEDGRSIREIAEGCGLKPITAYKIIRTLEAEHFLVRSTPPLRFQLGHAVHELKILDDGRLLLTQGARELLKAQRALPEANFVLLQWEDGDTYERLLASPQRFGQVIRWRERRVHSYEKASSLLFLAHASPEDKETFFRKHPFEKEGLSTWKSREKLDQFLEKIRRLGYAYPDFPDRNFHRLAAPVWSDTGRIVAVIAAFIPEKGPSKNTKKQMAALCRRTAERLTKSLGG
jgi:DNA-binding IclR family transcriptional regulator